MVGEGVRENGDKKPKFQLIKFQLSSNFAFLSAVNLHIQGGQSLPSPTRVLLNDGMQIMGCSADWVIL
ncbi:hypothetical protein A2T98_08095 [Nodularia spumigena CENA596]|uniref:Uncharacterized protein n=1 Tax=Nodularia spumigena CENA596 TaxID=1819295 RepID=A0A166JYN6_NODSP|nr:hypothetical protein A2T98_08095 [Nodularia spumigena CENA596]